MKKLRANYSSTPRHELKIMFGRSLPAIDNRARKMGLSRAGHREAHWSPAEIQVLREKYQTTGAKGVATLIGRASTAVSKKAQKLGLRINRKFTRTQRHRDWTKEDEEFLKSAVTTMTKQAIAAHLNRTEPAISMRLHLLRLVKEDCLSGRRHAPIGTERVYRGRRERKVAATGVRRLDWKRVEVIEWEAINGPIPEGMLLVSPKLSHFGEQRLVTRSEIPMLSAYDQMSDEIRSLLKTKSQISQALRRIEKLHPEQAVANPRKPRNCAPRKPWTEEKDEFLRKNYLHLSNKELAAALQRGFRGIESRLSFLRLVRPKCTGWSKDDEKLLIELYATNTARSLARRFGRTEYGVRRKLERLGIKKEARK